MFAKIHHRKMVFSWYTFLKQNGAEKSFKWTEYQNMEFQQNGRENLNFFGRALPCLFLLVWNNNELALIFVAEKSVQAELLP